MPQTEKLDFIGDSTVVVKVDHRYFSGNKDTEAQNYFDTAGVTGETATQTMLRLGLNPRSVHQVVGVWTHNVFISCCY